VVLVGPVEDLAGIMGTLLVMTLSHVVSPGGSPHDEQDFADDGSYRHQR